jgi:hypothetical protein
MKQEFMLEDSIEQEFWLGEDPMQFIVAFPSIGNG